MAVGFLRTFPLLSLQNWESRTFPPFRENDLKIPIKSIVFISILEPGAYFAFWSEKTEKCDYWRKSAPERKEVLISVFAPKNGNVRILRFGPENTSQNVTFIRYSAHLQKQ